MDLNFAEQLALARVVAEVEDVYSSSSSVSMNSFESYDMEQLRQYAEEAGVSITFTDCSDLRVQCAKVRMEHEMALLRRSEKKSKPVIVKTKKEKAQVRVPLKVAVKNVQFGFGCC
jgi:hypothetical protein